MSTTTPQYRGLGWMNGWQSDPPEYRRCRDLGHALYEQNRDPSNHGFCRVFWCPICGYYFQVDSTG